MWLFQKLHDPQLVVAFQRFCGVEAVSASVNGETCYGVDNHGNKDLNVKPFKGNVDSDSHSPPGNSQLNGLRVRQNGNGEANGHYNANVIGEDSAKHEDSEKLPKHLLTNGYVTNGHKHENNLNKPHKNGYNTSKNSESDSDHTEHKTNSYRITNYFWYYLFHLAANLGNEVFYITFLPFMVWNYDAYIMRRVVAFWALYMYLGQATKDILKVPRPASPPVIRLERRYALEYGLPSTHAMVGAGLPFSIYFLSVARYQFPWQIGLAICIVWCSLVSFSRIYLGMHSILDIIAGLLYVFGLMPVFFAVCEAWDEFALHHRLGPYIIILLPLTLCMCYPTLDKWSTARGDTTLILGVAAGAYLGSCFNVQYGYIVGSPVNPPFPFPFRSADIWHHFLRFILGGVILGLTREVMKMFSYRFLSWLFRLNKQDLREKQRLRVELPYKFVTYSVIGFNAIFTVPIIFSYLGIARVACHFEA